MFSIFDYLRKRTCDSVLAGVYDAMETIETEIPESLNLADGEIPPDEPPALNGPPPTNGATPAVPKKIASASAPEPKDSSAGNLFSNLAGNSGPLPPRKRGRPRKNPPEGSGQ